MKTQKLTLNQLMQDAELIKKENLNSIKGGQQDVTYNGGNLQEVTIVGTKNSPSADNFNFFNFNRYNNYGDAYGYLSSWGNENSYGGGGGGSSSYSSISSSNGTNYNLNSKFFILLSATGTTASSFGNLTADIHSIAKMGDFAKEAKGLLKNMSKYSGALGTAIDVIISSIEMLQDGNLTVDEASAFVANQIVGGAIGAIPFAGGVLSTIYDLTGGDDYMKTQIKSLITKYYGNFSLVSVE